MLPHILLSRMFRVHVAMHKCLSTSVACMCMCLLDSIGLVSPLCCRVVDFIFNNVKQTIRSAFGSLTDTGCLFAFVFLKSNFISILFPNLPLPSFHLIFVLCHLLPGSHTLSLSLSHSVRLRNSSWEIYIENLLNVMSENTLAGSQLTTKVTTKALISICVKANQIENTLKKFFSYFFFLFFHLICAPLVRYFLQSCSFWFHLHILRNSIFWGISTKLGVLLLCLGPFPFAMLFSLFISFSPFLFW